MHKSKFQNPRPDLGLNSRQEATSPLSREMDFSSLDTAELGPFAQGSWSCLSAGMLGSKEVRIMNSEQLRVYPFRSCCLEVVEGI